MSDVAARLSTMIQTGPSWSAIAATLPRHDHDPHDLAGRVQRVVRDHDRRRQHVIHTDVTTDEHGDHHLAVEYGDGHAVHQHLPRRRSRRGPELRRRIRYLRCVRANLTSALAGDATSQHALHPPVVTPTAEPNPLQRERQRQEDDVRRGDRRHDDHDVPQHHLDDVVALVDAPRPGPTRGVASRLHPSSF